MHQQPPWMCHNPNCAFRNRLVADAKLTTPHVCSHPPPIPIFVNPFPRPKPVTILPPPPLAPVLPRPLYFPPPGLPLIAPPAVFSIPGPPAPMMPPAPVPPGPYMLPPPPIPSAAPPTALSPSQPEPKAFHSASPEAEELPSTGCVVREKDVHKLEPKKGPISKHDKEALSDFEERTRRQEYRDLAESSKQQLSSKLEAPSHLPSRPQSILKPGQSGAPAVNQEVHVNVYNDGHHSKAEGKNNPTACSQVTKSVPAKDAASTREEAIKRAHNLAHGIAAAAAPAPMIGGALNPPPSEAGSKQLPQDASGKAPSHASEANTSTQPQSKAPSTIKAVTHKSTSTRARPNHHSGNPLALAAVAATANAQVSPPSIESWRDSVKRPVPA